MVIREQCKKEIETKTIIDKELGFEIESQIHDFNTKFGKIKPRKGWRIPDGFEGIKILDRHPEVCSKQNEWQAFWCEQVSETNRKKGLACVAFRSMDSVLNLNLDWGPSGSFDCLGVLFIRDLKKVNKK